MVSPNQNQQGTYSLEFGSLKYQGRLNTFCGGLVQIVCQPKQICSKGKSWWTRFVIGVDGAKKLQCMCQDSKRIGRSKDKKMKKSTKEQNDITVVQQYKRHVAQSCIQLFQHMVSTCSSCQFVSTCNGCQLVCYYWRVLCCIYIHVFSLY